MKRQRVYARRVAIALTMGLGLGCIATVAAHEGHSNPKPWEVCAHKTIGDGCHWSDSSHNEFVGSCRNVGEQLVCIRSQPIRPAGATQIPSTRPSGVIVVTGAVLALLVLISWSWRKRRR